MKLRSFGFLSILAVQTALGQRPPELDPTNYDRFLVPIAFTGNRAGAFGSRWESRVSVRNDAARPVVISQFSPQCMVPCGGLVSRVPAETTMQLEPSGALKPINNLGIFLHVEKSYSKQVFVSARVREVGQSSQSLGIEVPVISRAE